jgi:hypothetical protein
MNVQIKSVIKAGGTAAVIGIILGLLAAIPMQRIIGTGAGSDAIGLILGLLAAIPWLGCVVVPLLGLSFILLPMAAGLGYGYSAQGKETLQESILGGALAGVFGGLIYGFATGLVSLATKAGAAAFLQDVDIIAASSSSIIGVVASLCVALFSGLAFGAIGGALWPAFQKR